MNIFRKLFGGGKQAVETGSIMPKTSVQPLKPYQLALLSSHTAMLEGFAAAGNGLNFTFQTSGGALESTLVSQQELEWAVKVCSLADKATEVGNQGNNAEALKIWLQVYDLAPAYTIGLMSIGVNYAEIGDFKKGIAYLEEALRLDPKNTRIANNLQMLKAEAMRRGGKG